MEQMTREEKIISLVPVAQGVTAVMSRGKTQAQYDENLSSAYLGIIKAVDSYRPGHGASLKTFADNKACFEVMEAWRREAPVTRRQWAKVLEAERTGGSEPLVDRTIPLEPLDVDLATANPRAKPVEDEAINGLACEQILAAMKPSHAMILRRRFLEDVSRGDLAAEMDTHPDWVSTLTTLALAEARKVAA